MADELRRRRKIPKGTVRVKDTEDLVDVLLKDTTGQVNLNDLIRRGKISKTFKQELLKGQKDGLTPRQIVENPGKGAKVKGVGTKANIFTAADEFIIDGKANLDDVIEFFASNPASNKEKLAILNELKLRKAIPPSFL